MSSGLFITFEGPDGSGKTTQAEMLSAALGALALHPVVVREPGGTQVGERIRELLLDGHGNMHPETEKHLFLAARAELVAEIIAPSLAGDRIVIADRYHDSTRAYQGGARGLETDWPAGFPRPDLTFLLRIDPAAGLARRLRAGGADRLESESIDFHKAVSAAYDLLAMQEPDRFIQLDATTPASSLHQQVLGAVCHALEHKAAETEAAAHPGARSSS